MLTLFVSGSATAQFRTGVMKPVAQKSFDLDKNRISNWTIKEDKSPFTVDRITNTRAFKISAVPIILIGGGLYTFKDSGPLNRKSIHDIRQRYLPDFRNRMDDYLQYGPIAAVYALNALGVKGKHTPQRATVSLGLSILLSSSIVHITKSVTKIERPDGSAKNSFPSGHTAMAFVAATFLHKEFGQYRSPVYSILGYSTATTIGIFRYLNDRHWVSDVLTGAGVGIISTELSYLLAEAIYGDRKKNDPLNIDPDRPKGDPSFLSYFVGPVLLVNQSNANGMRSFNMGVEGAYFFSKNWGVGMELSFASFPFSTRCDAYKKVEQEVYSYKEASTYLDKMSAEPGGLSNVFFGPYFNYDLGAGYSVNGKINAGYITSAKGKFLLNIKDDYVKQLGKKNVVYAQYEADDTWGGSFGAGVTKMLTRNLGVNLYVNYYFARPDMQSKKISSVVSPNEYYYEVKEEDEFDNLDYISFGVSLKALLW